MRVSPWRVAEIDGAVGVRQETGAGRSGEAGALVEAPARGRRNRKNAESRGHEASAPAAPRAMADTATAVGSVMQASRLGAHPVQLFIVDDRPRPVLPAKRPGQRTGVGTGAAFRTRVGQAGLRVDAHQGQPGARRPRLRKPQGPGLAGRHAGPVRAHLAAPVEQVHGRGAGGHRLDARRRPEQHAPGAGLDARVAPASANSGSAAAKAGRSQLVARRAAFSPAIRNATSAAFRTPSLKKSRRFIRSRPGARGRRGCCPSSSAGAGSG